ncbi:MAG TPA: methionyl-tRNA formyltransferase [Anaerolineae bacterium]|nr:methionyl-tRNA formyltransferase [Anaerolineae bacterium]
MARIVFMGTPEFAVPTLQALAARHEVAGVVTQPDRPAGRGRECTPPPVKEAAAALGIEVLQPRSLRPAEVVARLAAWRPDVIVVAAFGQILPPAVLDLPPHGCLNVHASLLPRYRGAAPISAAILAGDDVTGVTIMRMDEGLDTGPILSQAKQPIGPEDTTGTLSAALAQLGARLLAETLPAWLAGEIEPQPQDETSATYCQMLTKEDGQLDWSAPAVMLDRQVRAVDPWPGAYSTWQDRRLQVRRARPRPDWRGDAVPGQVVELEPGIGVAAGEGALELLEVQVAGRKPMDIVRFTHGQREFVGSVLRQPEGRA